MVPFEDGVEMEGLPEPGGQVSVVRTTIETSGEGFPFFPLFYSRQK